MRIVAYFIAVLIVTIFFSGCHTIPYSAVGLSTGAQEGWHVSGKNNFTGKIGSSIGLAVGGLISGFFHGLSKDIKFLRDYEFDYSHMFDPFNRKGSWTKKESESEIEAMMEKNKLLEAEKEKMRWAFKKMKGMQE